MASGGEIERAPALDLVAAQLRAESSDLAAFVEGLAAKLELAVPGLVRIDRGRGRLFGPKAVRKVTLDAGGERLELSYRDGSDRVETKRARVSGGITLSSEELPIEAWIEALSEALVREAEHSGRTRQALERLLMQ
jgi:hypothetical protein